MKIHQYFSSYLNTNPKISPYNIKWNYTTFKENSSIVANTILQNSNNTLTFFLLMNGTKKVNFLNKDL